MDRDTIIDTITKKVKEEMLKEFLITVEVSARHVHLSREHFCELFGDEYIPVKKKDLSQPGQFQYKERVMLIGPGGVIGGVAILGPPRSKTQIEITRTDAFALGINPPVRDSGDLDNSGTLFIAHGKSMVKGEESVIIAKRHIHMTKKDSEHFNVFDKQMVNVKVFGQRPLIFEDVLVRVSDSYVLRMHIDFDEANASGLSGKSFCTIYRSAQYTEALQ